MTLFHHFSVHFSFTAAVDRDVDFPMSVSTEPIALNTESEEVDYDVIIPTTSTSGDTTIQVTAITDVEMITPWYLKLTWMLYEMSLSMTALSSLFYWLAAVSDSPQNRSSIDVHNNILFPFLLVTDMLLSKTPVRLLHCAYVYITCVLYACTSVLYSRYGNKSVTLDKDYGTDVRLSNHCDVTLPFGPWTSHLQEAVVSIAVCLIVVPVIHLLWFVVYQSRVYAWRRYGYSGSGTWHFTVVMNS